MSENTSIINHPRFPKWVKDFNPNEPKFTREVQKRNEESESRFIELEERAKRIEREMDWRMPIGEYGHVRD